MADKGRAASLSAARQKLREFQRQNRSPNGVLAKKKATESDVNSHLSTQNFPVDTTNVGLSQNGVNASNGAPVERQSSSEDAVSRPSKPSSTSSLPPSDRSSPTSSLYTSPVGAQEPQDSIGTSTAESLRQLLLQVNGLAVGDQVSSYVLDGPLAQRNQELASSLQAELQAKSQLELQLQDVKNERNSLQMRLQEKDSEYDNRLTQEKLTIQEQLSAHAQTISILVGERTDLQNSLKETQIQANLTGEENESLRKEVSEYRRHIEELRRQLSENQHNLQLQINRQNQEFVTQEAILSKTKKESEALEVELRESQNRVKQAASVQSQLEEQLSTVRDRLHMAELTVRQLQTVGGNEVEVMKHKQQLEAMQDEKQEMEHQLNEYKDQLQRLNHEHVQASNQYMIHVQTLTSQIQQLQTQADTTNSQEELIATLKRQIQEIEASVEARCQESRGPIQAELMLSKQISAQLQNEKDSLTNHCKVLESEKERYLVEISSLKSRIEEIETKSGEVSALLKAAESDKVAASRATQQNRELKEQLEELQNAFVKHTQDKVEAMEQYEGEQRVSRELAERLAHQEEELGELRAQLVEKETSMQQLESKSNELSRQMIAHDQIADRMRHYEAQGHLTETLQHELQQAKDEVKALSVQNNELRQLVTRAEWNDSHSSDEDPTVESLKVSVLQLQRERDELLQQLEEKSKTEVPNSINVQQQLEQKLKSTMTDIAELTEEKHRLEHLVTQLQEETDTIAEYVSLYRVQRGVLRQQSQEKENFIQQLVRDRDQLQAQFSQLEDYVQKMMKKGGAEVNEIVEAEPQKIIGQIRELISDIGSSVPETFHPCPCCSGKLINV